jgi:hypothetical protein
MSGTTRTKRRKNVMTGLARLKSSFEVFVSATRVAAAVENRRRPRPSDMKRLGFDPDAFTSIGLG